MPNAATEARARGWEMQERGWWTHPEYGGVCKEADGYWHVYPGGAGPEGTVGRRSTMLGAVSMCEAWRITDSATAAAHNSSPDS